MGFRTKHLQREEVKMADNVSFKVYLKDPSQGEETEVRRFVVDKEVSTSLVYIKEKLVSIFPILVDKIFSVSWTDEDGDSITIDTDEELILALTELPGPVYKLTATVRAASLWSCLLDTNPYIFGSQHWEGTNPIYGQCLKHKWSKLYLHWCLCRDLYIYVFSQIAI